MKHSAGGIATLRKIEEPNCQKPSGEIVSLRVNRGTKLSGIFPGGIASLCVIEEPNCQKPPRAES